MLREEGYKPRILAVDEFAIHKGHSYATCVMDLEQGDILWVGKGRAMKNFEKFFEDVPSDSLSAVIAVAMDMNASYNKLVTKHLPKARIVYDWFHMQSQFGRDVLGVVRLDEARRHKAKEKEILADISNDTDKETRNLLNKKLKRKSRNTANSRSCAGHCSLTLINSPTVKPSNYNLFCKIITTLLFFMP